MRRTISFKISDDFNGISVKDYLSKYCKISRRAITELKKSPFGILCNGKHTRTIDFLYTDDILTISLNEVSNEDIPHCNVPVPIIYEDDDIIIFNKPQNMPVHQSLKHYDNTLSCVYAKYLSEKSETGTFRALNRLDKDTNGAVVVAKNLLSAGVLAKAVEKRYYCMVEGKFPREQMIIDLPIARENEDSQRRCVRDDGERAITECKVLASSERATLLSCRLHTGRTHQIRVHMAKLSYPVIGDTLYGNASEFISGQALHCGRVRFKLPFEDEIVEFLAEPYPEFVNLGEIMGIDVRKYLMGDSI